MEPLDNSIDWSALKLTSARTVSKESEIPRPSLLLRNWRLEFTRDRRVAHFATLDSLLKRFSPGERLALYGLTTALGLSAFVLMAGLSSLASVAVPAAGGTITEGEVTAARFVNPILAVSQADNDITALVYSGLMRAMPDGTFIPDLAQDFKLSDDGTTYTFTLRPDATFHDGTPVTSADVLYTVLLAQNPDVKSPRRADWEGVAATAPDAHTVIFTLPHAYAPFIENTTFGVLPKHTWDKTSPNELLYSTLNTHPVGSGPFKVKNVKTDETGAVTRYDLVPFTRFTLGTPYLSHISFVFFPNNEAMLQAYNSGYIDAIAALSPDAIAAIKNPSAQMVMTPLPRVFGVFFNVNKNAALADTAVRRALDAAIDKPALVARVLGGFATTLDGPIPPGIIGDIPPAQPVPLITQQATSTIPARDTAAVARAILEKGGWSWDDTAHTWTKNKTVLAVKIATADSPELAATAQEVAQAWRAAGVQVSVQIYPLSEFNNTILRPREYESILFGEIVGRDADLFAFWHSSQRNDPGLNLALYANTKTDSLLTQARSASNQRERAALYGQFEDILKTDMPATFLYAPTFLYILPSELKGVEVGALTNASERFLNAYQWYTETQYVWDLFTS